MISATTSRNPIGASGMLRFGDGHATFTCSTMVEGDQRVHIVGTTGRIEIEIAFNIPPNRPGKLSLTSGGTPAAPSTEVITAPPGDQYTLQADAFAKSITDGTDHIRPAWNAVANMKVIDALIKSAESGTWV